METLKQQIEHGIEEKDGDRPHTALEYFIHFFTHPGRLILSPFYRHIEKRYTKREKFEIKFLLVDLFLLLISLTVIILGIIWLIDHNKITNRIFFEAQVAPNEIVSGASSTLVIRYTNGTGEELRNVFLTLSYPAHFQLQELIAGETPVEGSTVALGDLAPGTVGAIKIKGIMFGDVGGEQIFKTKMTFNYGQKNKSAEKEAQHTFSPCRSVLQLSLAVPEKIIASQSFTGNIIYKNTGENDLPEIIIKPEWPENFLLLSMNPPAWKTPAIKAGAEGKLEFIGIPQAGAEKLNFSFYPSFIFGDDESKQETLKQEITVIQPQVEISHSVDAASAKPGGSLKTIVRYKNTGPAPIYDLTINIASESPFAVLGQKQVIGKLEAGESGEKEIFLKLYSTISQSETTSYEHLNLDTSTVASYKIEDQENAQTVTVYGTKISTPLTSPITLKSFGRYASEQGDQLGRGPLPPIVGEETKYWIFWNVSGTTNEINNLIVSGQLPTNVTFTGRQTVSAGSAITYDAATRTVNWKNESVTTTFSPSAKILGAAFEVAITPTDDQIGTSPLLISNILLSGTDNWTGAWLTASGTSVSTNLPNDIMAKDLGLVEN